MILPQCERTVPPGVPRLHQVQSHVTSVFDSSTTIQNLAIFLNYSSSGYFHLYSYLYYGTFIIVHVEMEIFLHHSIPIPAVTVGDSRVNDVIYQVYYSS